MDDQDNTQPLESDLNDFRPMPRNLFIGKVEQEQSNSLGDERTPIGYATQPKEQFHIPAETKRRHSRQNASLPERPMEFARTTELEEKTRVLEMATGTILSRLIPDVPLIPLLNRGEQPVVVVATCNSPALSNVVVPTKPRGSGRLNLEPGLSKHNDELMKKNAELEKQLKDMQSAPLNMSITAKPYQEGFKIPHLETYDGFDDPDEHLHAYQAIMKIQNITDAMMCKVFPATLKSIARRWEIKRTAIELMQVHQREGDSLRDYMQWFNKATLDIDNVPDTICLSTLLHDPKPSWFLNDLLENPLKSWNEVNDRPLKRPFEETEWENMPITFSPADYKRLEGKPNVMMPHTDPFVATIHIGNHNVNKVFIDTSSSLDILYWRYFQKMQLNAASLKKYERLIYGFNNQPIPVEGVITLPIYVGAEPRFRMASVNFMKAEPVELVETIPLNPNELEKMVKIGTKLIEEERMELLEFLKANQDVFAWTTDEMFRIPTKLAVHKLSTNPTKKPVVQKCRLFGLEKQATIDAKIQKLLQMKLNPLKCTFAVESDKFLGYVVSKKRIEVNLDNVEAMQQMKPPKTVKDVQHLTSRLAALHRFIARLPKKMPSVLQSFAIAQELPMD
ncbi:hypothetical protein SLEP1_g22782 [Rubroshorea leprosula]|uniref:Retrotransposon gag domain-containing protein n=1 Tax=Rubroshorea leprosula TaxID=152421 RepID=A0AAV5JGB9_9ROSI|nr:hypothetical protein SLEP1_g22782 [Rubroshorea leprosula]